MHQFMLPLNEGHHSSGQSPEHNDGGIGSTTWLTTYPDSTIRFVLPIDSILLLYTMLCMLCIHMYGSFTLTLNCK